MLEMQAGRQAGRCVSVRAEVRSEPQVDVCSI